MTETKTQATQATGPLHVSTKNPRYFTSSSVDGVERAVYLTGSHIWNNLHDGMGPGADGPAEPERFDYDGYLRFLPERRRPARPGPFRLRRSPALPHRARPQLHPAVAMGAGPFAGSRRQLPPEHDA